MKNRVLYAVTIVWLALVCALRSWDFNLIMVGRASETIHAKTYQLLGVTEHWQAMWIQETPLIIAGLLVYMSLRTFRQK